MSLVGDYADAQQVFARAEGALVDALGKIVGNVGDYELRVDPVDWDGTSVELTEVRPGWEPTEDQQEAIFALGCDVIRIDYEDQHTVSGAWWRVKGRPTKDCTHKGAAPVPSGEEK